MTRYEQGFMRKCAEHGVNIRNAMHIMMKMAERDRAGGAATGAAVGAATGMSLGTTAALPMMASSHVPWEDLIRARGIKDPTLIRNILDAAAHKGVRRPKNISLDTMTQLAKILDIKHLRNRSAMLAATLLGLPLVGTGVGAGIGAAIGKKRKK